MKKLLVLFLISIVFASSCVKINTPGGIVVWGSKELTTQSLDFQQFNEIIISDKIQVTIRQGADYSIKVKTNQNLQDFIAIEKKWTVLSVKMKPNHFYKDAVLEVEVTMSELEHLDINGMSNAILEDFTISDILKIEITEAGKLEGKLQAENLEMVVKNGSSAELTGSTNYLKIEGVIGAKIGMANLSANRANIYLSVGSEAEFLINDTFNAGLKNGSIMTYSGNGKEGKIFKDDSSQLIKN